MVIDDHPVVAILDERHQFRGFAPNVARTSSGIALYCFVAVDRFEPELV
jgi:hypothetical protein